VARRVFLPPGFGVILPGVEYLFLVITKNLKKRYIMLCVYSKSRVFPDITTLDKISGFQEGKTCVHGTF